MLRIKYNLRQKRAMKLIESNLDKLMESYQIAKKGVDSGFAGKSFEFMVSTFFDNLRGHKVKPPKMKDIRKKIDGKYCTFEVKQGTGTVGTIDKQGEHKFKGKKVYYNLSQGMNSDYMIYLDGQFQGTAEEALNAHVIPMQDFIAHYCNPYNELIFADNYNKQARLNLPNSKTKNDIDKFLNNYPTLEEFLFTHNILQYEE